MVMDFERSLEMLFKADEADYEADKDLLEAAQRRLAGSLDGARRPQAAIGLVSSPIGRLLVAMTDRGVVLISYVRTADGLDSAIGKLRRRFDPVADQDAVRCVASEVHNFLAGDETALRQKVDLRMVGSDFHKKLLERLCKIAAGATITYQALGAWAGAPHSQRAVGGAMHSNPIPIYVPCHRVIRSDGSLGGYGGGLDVKRKLLRTEGFSITSAGVLGGPAVWGNRRTGIFCRPDCRAAARSDRSHMLLFRDAARAIQAGMRSCRLCRPE